MWHRYAWSIRWIVLSAVALGIAVAGLWGYLRVTKFEALATAGRVSAAAALQRLGTGDPEGAIGSLYAARRQFASAQALLGPDWLQSSPWVGPQVTAASDLCTVGIEASTAGIQIARLLDQASRSSDEGRLNRLLRATPTHLEPALASLVRATEVIDRLEPDGLVPQLANAVTSLKNTLSRAEPLLGRSRALLALERELFSRQHRFLVVTQNSAELRPSGGFIETFGLAEFGPEGFALTRHDDIHALPEDTLNLPSPLGERLGSGRLRFEDANWWIDFPTSAERMLELWRNLGQPEVDGIVAVDIPMIQNLLRIHGPIQIAESKEPLSADNVVAQLTTISERDRTASTPRGNPVLALANALVNRVTDMTADQVGPTLDALLGAANQKHLQIYLVNPQAQADMVVAGWSGALDPPADTTDLLAVSNGVVTPSKANLGVTKTIDYRVQLKPDGSARTTLTLGYRKPKLTLAGVPEQTLDNYVRAHRPPGTELTAKAKGTFSQLRDRTGLPTFGDFFRLDRGTVKVVLRTTLPQVMRPAANPDGTVWHYRLLLAKQADLVNVNATATVVVPDGWRVTGSAATFRVTGQSVDTAFGATTVTVATPLLQDLLVDVTLSPA